MKTTIRTLAIAAMAVATAAAGSGCRLNDQEPPPLTGPSTYFLSLTMTASPDVLAEDGSSQSVIKVVARDHNGQPVRNVALRFDVMEGGRIVEFGTLTARNVTTNTSGEATTVFTAPRSAIPGFDSGTIVQVVATPIGTDFGTTNPRSVTIRLVPETVATAAGAPTASFTYTPVSPAPSDVITFNGSASTDSDGTIVRYRWTFSDGHTEPEQAVVSHDFPSPGTYFVTLTVTDNEGKSASVTRSITVSSGS